MERTDFSAIILAGGMSSRMEDFKPLLDLGGTPALLRTLESFRMTGVTNFSVVLGHCADQIQPVLHAADIDSVMNPNFKSGMFSSIQIGVNSLPPSTKAFFILPADIPLIRRSTIRRMIKTFQKMTPAVAYPTFMGKRGHPPLIHARCIKDILAADPEDNLRRVLEKYEAHSWDTACADKAIHLDMDTKEDYTALKHHLQRRDIPSLEECAALMEIHNAPPAVLKHGQAVASLAKRIAASLNLCQHAPLDIDLLEAAGILHDIAKGCPSHARTGAAIMLEEGFPRIAACIAPHMNLRLPEGDSWGISEKEILYLADKIVQEDRIVSLEQRFKKSEEKAGGDTRIIHFIRERREVARTLMNRIEDCIRSSHQGLLPWEAPS